MSSQRLANELLLELISLGVEDIVVCPGSRSQALALAAAEAESAQKVRLHVRIDERSAAYFALGIGKESGFPAVVIVTSGTAVANLLPAIMEAHYGRVPLIILTADRPKELRGVRSNQTVHDVSYTQEFVRYWDEPELTRAATAAREAFTASRGVPAGPSHLNIAFSEPLSGDVTDVFNGLKPGVTGFETRENEAQKSDELFVLSGDAYGTVVVAGSGAGKDAEHFAMRAGLPLFAEPSSGSRFGREAIQHYETLLKEDSQLRDEINRVVVFGHPTLTRVIPQLVLQTETIVIDEACTTGVEVYNPGRSVGAFARRAVVDEGLDPQAHRTWLGAWIKRDRALREEMTALHTPNIAKATATGYKERSSFAREEVARLRAPATREHLTELVWQSTWPHDRLMLASSRLVRVLNRQAAPRNIKVYANRGLAGIDGTIATGLGIAMVSQCDENPRLAAGATRILLGDLAFLHDVGSLALTPGEMRPRVQVIVGNDNGGTIFKGLEVAASANPEAFARVMLTPQTVDLSSIAKAYGWAHRAVKNQGELEDALSVPITGPEILEVALV